MAETQIKLHLDYSPTTYWAFDGVVPGPLIQAKYGEPVLLRYHNHLPSVKILGYGVPRYLVAQRLTPSESDGNPVNYFNSISDPNAINPNGFKDQHYPNVLAGFPIRHSARAQPCRGVGLIRYHDPSRFYRPERLQGRVRLLQSVRRKDTGIGFGLASVWRIRHSDLLHDVLLDKNCQTVFDLFN
jgi:hypothetical protein